MTEQLSAKILLPQLEAALDRISHLESRLAAYERPLDEQQRFLQQIVGTMPNGIYIYHVTKQQMTFANQRLSDMLGCTLAQLYQMDGDTLAHFVDAADLDAVTAMGEQVYQAADDDIVRLDYRIKRADSQLRWVRAHSKVFSRAENGEVRELLSVLEDVTERKEARTALKRSQEHLILAFEATNDGIWDWNLETDDLYFSPRWKEILGYADHELPNSMESWRKVMVKEDWAKTWRLMDAYNRGHSPSFEMVQRFYHRNESIVYILSRAIHQKNEAGRVIRLVGAHTDITLQTLTEEAMSQAVEDAEQANQAKSQFLANMSHEIRTPLNAIIGMSNLLLDTPLSAEQKNFAETVRTGSNTLLMLINDILDFSKIEAGKFELEHRPFNLHQCLAESVDLVANRAAEKGLELIYSFEHQTPLFVVGDVTRLHQILVNLLNNAIKFTGHGEVELAVTSRRCSAENAAQMKRKPTPDMVLNENLYELEFVVKDTGIGIPADRLERLFSSFSQVDASTTRRYGGTGLGLTISKRLCELMHGVMWVESEFGVGSKFYFTVMLYAEEAQEPTYVKTDQPELKDKRVLIVDDNATNRRLLMRQTRTWGMLPTVLPSAIEALDWIQVDEGFDLGLIDFHMPEMDGGLLARQIRKYRSAEELPLILLSSMITTEGQPDDLHKPFAATLSKPTNMQTLHQVIINVLTNERFEQPAKQQSLFDEQLGQRHPLKILLVEDNIINQQVALLTLKKLGYQADVVMNGLEALQTLQHDLYDVVLMDIQMPEMDGLEATAYIRKTFPKERQPHVIALTADALVGDQEKYINAGMDDYLSKPLQIKPLIKALTRVQAQTQQTPTQLLHSELDTLDLTAIYEAVGGDEEVVQSLIEEFLSGASEAVETLKQAVVKKDLKTLRLQAHTLRSNCDLFGAIAMSNICHTLETSYKQLSPEALQKLVDELASRYIEFERLLLAQLPSA